MRHTDAWDREPKSRASEIAELQRMIPICSICHRIRDQEESWSRVEAYFKNHWDIDFSHGLCPDCYKKEMEKLKEDVESLSDG